MKIATKRLLYPVADVVNRLVGQQTAARQFVSLEAFDIEFFILTKLRRKVVEKTLQRFGAGKLTLAQVIIVYAKFFHIVFFQAFDQTRTAAEFTDCKLGAVAIE